MDNALAFYGGSSSSSCEGECAGAAFIDMGDQFLR
jgi:hypothetical protein